MWKNHTILVNSSFFFFRSQLELCFARLVFAWVFLHRSKYTYPNNNIFCFPSFDFGAAHRGLLNTKFYVCVFFLVELKRCRDWVVNVNVLVIESDWSLPFMACSTYVCVCVRCPQDWIELIGNLHIFRYQFAPVYFFCSWMKLIQV